MISWQMLTSQLFAKTVCQKMAETGLGWVGPGWVGLGRAFDIMDAKEQGAPLISQRRFPNVAPAASSIPGA